MGIISRLIVRIAADTKPLDRGLQQASGRVKRFGGDMRSAGMAATAGITLPLLGVAAAALQAAGKMEQSKIAFGTLLGSAAAGKKMLDELQQFALATPFEFEELQDTAKRLMAMGFAADEVIPTMRTLGNAVSALGGGPELFNRIAINLGQMKSTGVVAAREMRDFAMAGIPAWELLADAMGKSVMETRKLVSKGQVEASVAIEAMMSSMDKRFGGLMKRQMESLFGMWSNIKDKLFKVFVEIGEGPLLDFSKDLVKALEGVIAKVGESAKAFKKLPSELQTASFATVGLVAAIGPTLFATGTLLWAFSQIAAMVPKIAGMLGVGGIGLTGVMLALSRAVGLVGVAWAGWEIGTWLRQNDVIRDMTDATADLIMMIPGVTKLMGWWTGTTEALAAATGNTVFMVRKLEDSLAWAGIDLPEYTGNMDDYLVALQSLTAVNTAFVGPIQAVEDAVKNQAAAVSDATNEYHDWLQELEAVSAYMNLVRPSGGFSIANAKTPLIEPPAALKPTFDLAGSMADAAGVTIAEGLSSGFNQFGELANRRLKSITDLANQTADSTIAAGQRTFRSIGKGASVMSRQISTIMTDMSRQITDLIFEGGKFSDVLKSIGQAIVRAAIESQFQRISNLIVDMTKDSEALNKVFKEVFGQVSKVSDSISKVSGAGGAAGGAGGAAASAGGLIGIINMAANVVSAVTGVINVFQQMHQETSLNAIEWNTRKSSLHLEHILTTGVNQWLPYLELIHRDLLEGGFGIGGAPVTINVNGSADAAETATEVVRILRLNGAVAA